MKQQLTEKQIQEKKYIINLLNKVKKSTEDNYMKMEKIMMADEQYIQAIKKTSE